MNRQYMAVMAICASIILASVIMTLGPQGQTQEFRFPVGIPPALGATSITSVGEQQTKIITISGSGKASARANQATLTLGAQTDNTAASEAVNQNAELMTAIIDAIKAQGIAEDDIETVSYSISPVYDSNWQKVVGYRVINLVQVKVSDLNKVGAVIDAAGKAGANRIEGISFGLSDDLVEELKLDAYVDAIRDARSKSDVIAQNLGIKILGVLSVSESYYYPYTPVRGSQIMSYDKASTPIFEGALSVSVTLQIVYEFE